MASVKKIRISDPRISSKEAFEYYNGELKLTILGSYDRAILVLNDNIPADHFLWEWSLEWKNNFLESGKLLSILTSNRDQSDALNGIHLNRITHPNQNSSSHDLQELYTDLHNYNFSNFSENPKTPDSIDNTDLIPIKNIEVSTGDYFEITGEYSCLECGEKTLFMKGEAVSKCINKKCTSPQKGWKLTLELF